jgi:hypothetical protein
VVLGRLLELGRRSRDGRAAVVALDPDRLRGVVVDAVQRDVLVARQGALDRGAVGEVLGGERGLDVAEGRV